MSWAQTKKKKKKKKKKKNPDDLNIVSHESGRHFRKKIWAI